MNRNKVKEMIQFSFYKNIQNKWFILFNLISLVSAIIMLNWSSISSIFKQQDELEPFEIAILDSENLIFEDFYNELKDMSDFEITQITENNYTAENIPDDFAIIEVLPNADEIFQTSIISKEGINTTIYNPMLEALTKVRNNLLLEKYDVTSTELAAFQKELTVNRIMLSVNAEDSTTKELIKLFSSALTYLLTILIFTKMANEIAQEKQSKSSEYVLTTVSAKEYLFAKIFSNIAILLIQGLFLFVYYFIAITISNLINIAVTDLTIDSGILNIGLSLDVILYILALIGYNILNLILLCIIQATLSAKTSSTSEAGNTVSLLTFLMMGAYIATVYLITPYTKVNLFLNIISCLPILSAYFIPALMVIGQAQIWQIILSFLFLILGIPFTFNYCAKIFKNGILDYTKMKKKTEKQDILNLFLTKRKIKHLGFVVGLSILLYIGSQTLFSLLFQFTFPTLFKSIFNETEITLITQILLQIISLGLASAFVFTYCEKHDNKIKNTFITNSDNSNKKLFLPIHSRIKIILITLFFVFALQVFLSLILYPALGLDYNITDMFEVNYESSLLTKLILIIALAVIPAVFEELFFRKALINFTLPYGKKFALIFSSLLFGLIHMNLSQGLFAFIMGLVFGSIYLFTNDIKIPIIIHFINNGFAALTMILPEYGVVIVSLILLIVLLSGFIQLIKLLIKKSSREKLLALCKTPVDLNSFSKRYQYLFTDFTFDVALVLVVLMSLLTENLLR